MTLQLLQNEIYRLIIVANDGGQSESVILYSIYVAEVQVCVDSEVVCKSLEAYGV